MLGEPEEGDESTRAADRVQRARRRRRARGQRDAHDPRRGHADPPRVALPHYERRCSTPSPRSSRRPSPTSARRGTLTEDDVNKAMREIRLALLEADVNFKVVKQFTATVKERCLGADVVGALNPGQQVVKIVNEELAALMGGASAGITFSPRPPTVILMAGLQGSGKTTATAKLARHLREEHGSSVARRRLRRLPPGRGRPARQGRRPGRRRRLRAGHRPRPGRHRPLGAGPRQDGRQGRPDRRHLRPPARRREADGRARATSAAAVKPHAILLVVDAMTGQDAVNVAEQFAQAVAVRRRRDDQARRRRPRRRRAVGQGGHRQADPVRLARARSSTSSSASTPTAWRSASSGWATSCRFIEKAERQFDEDEAKELERKLRRNEFTLEDFLGPAQADPQDGPADLAARDDARVRGPAARRT